MIGPVTYIDRTNSSFNFPLLVSSESTGGPPFLLIAEVMVPKLVTQQLDSKSKVTTMQETLAALQARAAQTPFDCLKAAGDPVSFLGARDQRLATLFYRLGIVLFELGRGVDYRSVVGRGEEFAGLRPEDVDMLRKSRVMEEIEKIPFGRSYADLVKVCLTGRLYATSLMDVDRRFNEAVVERLRRLEMHFSAILQEDQSTTCEWAVFRRCS
ncbi:hypothetical protein EJ04DRAFT_579067 [Polyplosphaeria fusca]|uniref:Uncharacterized protein n=1 Tax=Polyplosphaeria fusca TaxID=682080 RepID=A0A9P4QUE2_9PLEO|nr:hypothetical protein EJ04DRAFT_579067 [Polyplosphaeria fusca]